LEVICPFELQTFQFSVLLFRRACMKLVDMQYQFSVHYSAQKLHVCALRNAFARTHVQLLALSLVYLSQAKHIVTFV
jgi:hypothetical protein